MSQLANPSRRTVLQAVAGAAGVFTVRAQSASGAEIAKTIYGPVRGAHKDGVIVFKGIPYAGSPAGAGRFKPAPKLQPWSGVRDALLYGPQSVQPPDPMWPKEWKPAIANEECLYLSVWTPAVRGGGKRPVMFYSHGGGFATGNGGADVPPQDASHDGAALARDYDVVVVTHNHRLGIMGYLYLGDLLGEEYAASGAAGMLDIVAALEWVRDNIAEFGGDPSKVMIWGESGGGAKTTTLTAMPGAQGMYHRASIESGAALRLKTRQSAIETTRAVLASLDLREKDARQLLTVPAATLIEAQVKLRRPRGAAIGSVTSGLADGLGFSPMVDGHYIPANPYDPVAPAMSAKIPLIVGTNKDETLFLFRGNAEVAALDEAGLRRRLEPEYQEKTGRIVEVYRRSRPQASPSELYIAITTAEWMGMDAIRLAERKAALQAGPVFMYVFAYGRAAHAAEMPYKFDHVKEPADRARVARNMSRAWASFARNGNPGHDEIPEWPAYTPQQRATMFLDVECRVVDDPYREERLLWESNEG
jgi:para-nitrobenzyl esterase